MIQWNLSKEVAKTLINFMDHFYISTVDVDAIEDDNQKKDVKLAYYESCERMKSITNEEEDKFLESFEELRKLTISEYEQVDQPVDAPVV